MYYESNSVDDILKCSFCKSKFTDVVKLIPDCGNSICGVCYSKLLGQLMKSNEYKCQECDAWHCMQSMGLGDNKAFLKMLQIKPKEKALPKEGRILKSLIDGIQDKMKKLNNYDQEEEIVAYCNKLVQDVMKSIDDAFKHLNNLGNTLLEEINDFKNKAIATQVKKCPAKRFRISTSSSESSSQPALVPGDAAESELNVLTKEVEKFVSEWQEYFTQIAKSANDEEIAKAHYSAKAFQIQLESLEKIKHRQLFKGRIMRFKPNEQFCKSTKLLGELDFDFSIPEYLARVDKERVQATPIHTLKEHTKTVRQVLFISQERLASCSDDNTIKIWNKNTGELLYDLTGHSAWVMALAILPNDYLASGCLDGTIKIWDLREKKLLRTLKDHLCSVFSLLVLPNRKLVSGSWDDTIKLWDPFLNQSNALRAMNGHDCKFSVPLGLLSNGDVVSCSNNKAKDADSVIRVWNPLTAKMVKSLCTNSKLACMQVVLHNDTVAIGFKDGTVKVFDLSDQASLTTLVHFETKVVHSLIELPNGYLLSGGSGKEPAISVWNSVDGELIQTIPSDHTHIISTLCLSDDGKQLASGSFDKNIIYWSLTY